MTKYQREVLASSLLEEEAGKDRLWEWDDESYSKKTKRGLVFFYAKLLRVTNYRRRKKVMFLSLNYNPWDFGNLRMEGVLAVLLQCFL